MLLYKYIYYCLYKLYRKKNSELESILSPLFFVSILIVINALTILVFVDKNIYKIEYLKSSIHTVILLVLIYVINYFMLVHRKRYLKIFSKIESLKLTVKGRFLNGWLVTIYLIVSTISFILVLVY